MKLEDALEIVVGSDWANPIRPYSISTFRQTAQECYDDLRPEIKRIIDRMVR